MTTVSMHFRRFGGCVDDSGTEQHVLDSEYLAVLEYGVSHRVENARNDKCGDRI